MAELPFDKKDLVPPAQPAQPQGQPPAPQAETEKWFIEGKFKTKEDFDQFETSAKQLAEETQRLKEERQAMLQAMNRPQQPAQPQFDPYTGQPLQRPPTKEEIEQKYWQDPIAVQQQMTQQMIQQSIGPIVDHLLSENQVNNLRFTVAKDMPEEDWQQVSAAVRQRMASVPPQIKADRNSWEMVYLHTAHYMKDKLKGGNSPQPQYQTPRPTPLETPQGRQAPGQAIDNVISQDELDSEPWKEFNMTKEEWVEARSPFYSGGQGGRK